MLENVGIKVVNLIDLDKNDNLLILFFKGLNCTSWKVPSNRQAVVIWSNGGAEILQLGEEEFLQLGGAWIMDSLDDAAPQKFHTQVEVSEVFCNAAYHKADSNRR